MASDGGGYPVEVAGLDHWFGQGEARKQALFDVDLRLAAGTLTVLAGPSGSGKTTVLTLIGALRAIQKGNIRLLGRELAGASADALVLRRREIGFIFQAHNLHDSLTAEQNVRLGLEVHGAAAASRGQAAARHMLDLLDLSSRAGYLPANLSGGQKQRVAIARALVGNPPVVLADEPTAALDRESGLNVVQLLKRLGTARGTTTLMVTHDPRILDLADRIVRMEDGRIVAEGRL
ncbi:MAG: ATP-binding cassette domain-containing protein [Rhodospirillales bacterium]|nr:ATP-binding cassette domain-containing protein [Rhodospirillales bacterium]